MPRKDGPASRHFLNGAFQISGVLFCRSQSKDFIVLGWFRFDWFRAWDLGVRM